MKDRTRKFLEELIVDSYKTGQRNYRKGAMTMSEAEYLNSFLRQGASLLRLVEAEVVTKVLEWVEKELISRMDIKSPVVTINRDNWNEVKAAIQRELGQEEK